MGMDDDSDEIDRELKSFATNNGNRGPPIGLEALHGPASTRNGKRRRKRNVMVAKRSFP